MKKTISLILCFTLIVACGISLCACYLSKPGTMSDFIGTYELTTYTRTPKTETSAEDVDEVDESKAIDMLKEEGIQAYLIVKDDGTGYYVYKSNKTPAPIARCIKITYGYDDEDSSLLAEINYCSGGSTQGDGYPGKGEEKLGLTFGKKDKKLTFSMPAVFGRKFSQSVKYTKVNGATDLSYASKKLGTDLKAIDFEMYGLERFVSSNYYDETETYIYFLIDFHAADKKADVYYALKADGSDVVQRDLPVTVTAGEESTLIVKVGDYEFTRTNYSNVLGTYLYHYTPAQGEQPERYAAYYSETREIETVIGEIKENYASYSEQLNAEE